MKKLLFFLILIGNFAYGQMLTTTGQVNGWNYVVTFPASYSYSNIKYPTLIFFPGLGEIGTDISKLYANGPHAYISAGGNPLPNWIVISLQPPTAYPVEFATNIRIQALKQLFRIDSAMLNLTGLSHGGWVSSTFVTGDPLGGPYTYANQINTVITVQGVIPSDNQPYPQLFANFKGAGYLCFEQRLDGRGGTALVNYINSVRPGTATFIETNFSGGGHCCWSQFYGGQGVQPFSFSQLNNRNIYDWLGSKNTATVLTLNVPVRPPQIANTDFNFDSQSIYVRVNYRNEWALTDVLGRVVYRGTLKTGVNKIGINTLPRGMYYFVSEHIKRKLIKL